MEMVVTALVGLLGAVATIIGAYIQRSRGEAQHLAQDLQRAHGPAVPDKGAEVRTASDPAQVRLRLIFVADPYVVGLSTDRKKLAGGKVEAVAKKWTEEWYWDGESIGSGDCAKDHRIELTTTVGIHDLSTTLEAEYDFVDTRTGRTVNSSRNRGRFNKEIVLTRPGTCTIRIRGGVIKSFEPRDAGYVPFSRRLAAGLIVGGGILIAVSVLVVWLLRK